MPLATFRKYDKILLAVFGVLLMVAFLVGDPLAMITGAKGRGGGGGGDPSGVVSFKGGSLTSAQLQRMGVADSLANEYLRRIAAETMKKKQQPGDFPQYRGDQQRSEASIVENYLLARKAHELGLSLSNENIDEILRNYSKETLKAEDFKKLRQDVLDSNRGSHITLSDRDLYQQLRINLLAQEVIAMVRNGTESPMMEMMGMSSPRHATLPPTEAWDYFRRTARLVKVELLPLDVAKFLDDVKATPTAQQKNELFEKYKANIATPMSPEPGFASPHRMAFGYVRVDFKPFLDKAKEQITEEAVRAEYDKQVEDGKLTVPVMDDKPESDKPADDKPADDKPADEKPSEETPKDKKPEDPAPTDDVKPEAPKPESDKPADEEKPGPGSGGAEGQDEPAAEEKSADEKPADEKPASEKPADEKPAEPSSNDAEPAEEKQPAATTGAKKGDKKPETRVKTFDEAEDDLRTQLAQPIANKERNEALEELRRALEDYRAKYSEWEYEGEEAARNKKTNAKEQPELMPYLRPVLSKYDLKYHSTTLRDRFEIADEKELAEASFFDGRGIQPFEVIYNFGLKPFQAVEAMGFLRDMRYVVWVEQDQPAKAAERKDVEDDIVRAWKMQQAFDLAKAEATRLADEAKGKDGLRQAFPGGVDKASAILDPAPFSWLTSGFMPGNMGAQLRISEVPEVPYAGEDFMQTIMDLQPGEVGVTYDQPHKHVFVVRMVSQTPEEDVLRRMFLVQGLNNQAVMQQIRNARMLELNQWLANVQDEMQVKWNRP
jgi:hypothetical protein